MNAKLFSLFFKVVTTAVNSVHIIEKIVQKLELVKQFSIPSLRLATPLESRVGLHFSRWKQ